MFIYLIHLDKGNAYVRMLFIDYISAFNTMVPSKAYHKAHSPGTELLPMQLGPGLHDGPPPAGEGRQHYLLHTDPQHWYILSLLLYSPCNLDCVASNFIIKFADDTTVVGLITNNDEVGTLTVWCQVNNISLYVSKIKEQIVDFRRNQAWHAPIIINRAAVDTVQNVKKFSLSPPSVLQEHH
jgi:hypothetical protein